MDNEVLLLQQQQQQQQLQLQRRLFENEEEQVEESFEESIAGSNSWFIRYFRFIEKYRKQVFITWIVVLLFSLITGPQFLSMGNDSFVAPKGSIAERDQIWFDQRFKEKSRALPELVLFYCEDTPKCTDIRQEELFQMSKSLVDRVIEYNKTHVEIGVTDILGYFVSDLEAIKRNFISSDHKTAFIDITVTSEKTRTRYEFINFLNDVIEELNPSPEKYNIGVAGFDSMAKDSAEGTAAEVMRIDVITMPIAFIVLGFMVRSWRLLVIAWFNLTTSILFAFAIMAGFVSLTGLHPENAAAQLMEVMSLALSLDYCLFLSRRFRDEIKMGASPRRAVFLSLFHAGHVVVMSGLTIVVVFIGFLLIPARSVQMDGLNCAVAISICMIVSLTNTPAMLLLFPGFFSDFDIRPCRRGQSRRSCYDTSAPFANTEEILLRPILPEANEQDFVHTMYNSLRFRVTRRLVKWPCNLISVIVLYILVLPLAYQAFDLNVNQDILAGLARHSQGSKRFREMINSFPGGSFAPFSVILTVPESKTILSEEFFTIAQAIQQDITVACLKYDNRFTKSNINSPVFLSGKKVSLKEAEEFLFLARSPRCNIPLFCTIAKEFEFLWKQNVNLQENAMLITIIVPFFPFAEESSSFISMMREVLSKQDELHGKVVDIGFVGFEVAFNAISEQVYHMFPLMMVVTLTGVFIVLGYMLRSAFVIFRLFLTLLLPLAAVFGLGKLVYQDGILAWLSDATQESGGFFWYIPILITSMLVGLALDYDVFLISRVMEHRMNGYNIQASIVKAACETGGTISAAGIIMTLVFGGMLLGDALITNLCGWMLASGVLVDTFIVNTILVPALLSFGDSIAWFPTRMPMTNLKGLDSPEFPRNI